MLDPYDASSVDDDVEQRDDTVFTAVGSKEVAVGKLDAIG